MPVIYGLYDPTSQLPPSIRYVGYTSYDPATRLIEHISESKLKAKSHRHKWIRSLVNRGVRPAFLILDTVSEGQNWKEIERSWIAKLQSMRLVNATEGGEGLINPSSEVRARISEKVSLLLRGNQRRKGIPHDEASRAAMSAATKGEKVQAMYRRRKGMNVGNIWITDGMSNKYIISSEPIPVGWRRGITQRKSHGQESHSPSTLRILDSASGRAARSA